MDIKVNLLNEHVMLIFSLTEPNTSTGVATDGAVSDLKRTPAYDMCFNYRMVERDSEETLVKIHYKSSVSDEEDYTVMVREKKGKLFIDFIDTVINPLVPRHGIHSGSTLLRSAQLAAPNSLFRDFRKTYFADTAGRGGDASLFPEASVDVHPLSPRSQYFIKEHVSQAWLLDCHVKNHTLKLFSTTSNIENLVTDYVVHILQQESALRCLAESSRDIAPLEVSILEYCAESHTETIAARSFNMLRLLQLYVKDIKSHISELEFLIESHGKSIADQASMIKRYFGTNNRKNGYMLQEIAKKANVKEASVQTDQPVGLEKSPAKDLVYFSEPTVETNAGAIVSNVSSRKLTKQIWKESHENDKAAAGQTDQPVILEESAAKDTTYFPKPTVQTCADAVALNVSAQKLTKNISKQSYANVKEAAVQTGPSVGLKTNSENDSTYFSKPIVKTYDDAVASNISLQKMTNKISNEPYADISLVPPLLRLAKASMLRSLAKAALYDQIVGRQQYLNKRKYATKKSIKNSFLNENAVRMEISPDSLKTLDSPKVHSQNFPPGYFENPGSSSPLKNQNVSTDCILNKVKTTSEVVSHESLSTPDTNTGIPIPDSFTSRQLLEEKAVKIKNRQSWLTEASPQKKSSKPDAKRTALIFSTRNNFTEVGNTASQTDSEKSLYKVKAHNVSGKKVSESCIPDSLSIETRVIKTNVPSSKQIYFEKIKKLTSQSHSSKYLVKAITRPNSAHHLSPKFVVTPHLKKHPPISSDEFSGKNPKSIASSLQYSTDCSKDTTKMEISTQRSTTKCSEQTTVIKCTAQRGSTNFSDKTNETETSTQQSSKQCSEGKAEEEASTQRGSTNSSEETSVTEPSTQQSSIKRAEMTTKRQISTLQTSIECSKALETANSNQPVTRNFSNEISEKKASAESSRKCSKQTPKTETLTQRGSTNFTGRTFGTEASTPKNLTEDSKTYRRNCIRQASKICNYKIPEKENSAEEDFTKCSEMSLKKEASQLSVKTSSKCKNSESKRSPGKSSTKLLVKAEFSPNLCQKYQKSLSQHSKNIFPCEDESQDIIPFQNLPSTSLMQSSCGNTFPEIKHEIIKMEEGDLNQSPNYSYTIPLVQADSQKSVPTEFGKESSMKASQTTKLLEVPLMKAASQESLIKYSASAHKTKCFQNHPPNTRLYKAVSRRSLPECSIETPVKKYASSKYLDKANIYKVASSPDCMEEGDLNQSPNSSYTIPLVQEDSKKSVPTEFGKESSMKASQTTKLLEVPLMKAASQESLIKYSASAHKTKCFQNHPPKTRLYKAVSRRSLPECSIETPVKKYASSKYLDKANIYKVASSPDCMETQANETSRSNLPTFLPNNNSRKSSHALSKCRVRTRKYGNNSHGTVNNVQSMTLNFKGLAFDGFFGNLKIKVKRLV